MLCSKKRNPTNNFLRIQQNYIYLWTNFIPNNNILLIKKKNHDVCYTILEKYCSYMVIVQIKTIRRQYT